MNLIILGPQGSGKGTQAELLAGQFGLMHFEMGRVLRSIASSDNQWATQIKTTLNTGNLVPDELVRTIAWDVINKQINIYKGIIFEGYPRQVSQYDQLKDMLGRFGKKIDIVINIEISEEESIKRLSSRRVCEKCGEVYNLITNPPPTTACKCGGKLIHREDDLPEAIKKRLEIYRTQTMPVFERAQAEGLGVEINGEQSIEKVHEDIVKVVA